jgi:hypothetical protein
MLMRPSYAREFYPGRIARRERAVPILLALRGVSLARLNLSIVRHV